MPMTKKSATTSDAKRRYNGLLALCIITTILVTTVIAGGIQTSPPAASANPSLSQKAPGSTLPDPIAYIDGYHLYDVRNWNITSTGQNFTLDFPTNWNITRLGLNFFNGTLQQESYANKTPVKIQLNFQVGAQYETYITNLKVKPNSTVYQAMFNVTSITMLDNNFWSTVTSVSNSDYPVIDGNIGAGQRFFIPNYAESLSFQVALAKFDDTAVNLTAEVRRSTSDNNMGELVESVSVPSTVVSLGSNWVQIDFPHINLTTGYYLLVLHTDGWLPSGGGYLAATTLTKQPSTPASGWVTSDRGVTWQYQLTIAGSSFYFNGFKLRVHVKSLPLTMSNINLKINNIPVADNFIWNQSVWNAIPPYSFKVSSDYPLSQLNFTYKVWYYVYGNRSLFRNGYHITVNNNRTTTASASPGNFTLMRVILEQSDLLAQGVTNTTAGTVKLNLKLFDGNNTLISGSVNVTAWAQLIRKIDGLTFTGPYSLALRFVYTHPVGSDNNVTLSEGALSIGPINNQVDNVYVNNETVRRNRWIYSQRLSTLGVFREAFTPLPQFTLLGGSKLNCTVSVFNNFTASASTTITGFLPYSTPNATITVQNTTPLIDLDGLTQVNITVTNPNGLLINNTKLTLTGGQYKFNCTVSGEGIYGVKFISNDSTGHVATRWIGAATVDDFILAPPTVVLVPASNLTSQQTVLILVNASYVNHLELVFNGTLTITIYIGDTGNVTQLQATWNSTTKLYQATYQAPVVDSTTQLIMRVQACDYKHRVSTSFGSTYVVPQPPPEPPEIGPSSMNIIILAIIAVLVLVPTFAYFVEKYRKR